MKLRAKINNVGVNFTGGKEDVAYIVQLLFGMEQKEYEKVKVKKSKTLIKKIDAVTIEIEGKRLSLNHKSVNKVAGTDYCVYEQNGTYVISDNQNVKNAKKVGGFHYGLISENFVAQNQTAVVRFPRPQSRGVNGHKVVFSRYHLLLFHKQFQKWHTTMEEDKAIRFFCLLSCRP